MADKQTREEKIEDIERELDNLHDDLEDNDNEQGELRSIECGLKERISELEIELDNIEDETDTEDNENQASFDF